MKKKHRMSENEIGTIVVDSAIQIHRNLGPGLLEIVYEVVLSDTLRSLGLETARQVSLPIRYGNKVFDEGFRIDLMVENKMILELKSVEKTRGIHKKQVQTYLKLSGCRLGYLLNFGSVLMKQGITRCVNGLEE